MPQCRKAVEQSTQLTALIEQERLEIKQKEGEMTGRMDNLNAELAEKNKLIEIHKANHLQSLQDISRLTK
jgi:hypothetical protein